MNTQSPEAMPNPDRDEFGRVSANGATRQHGSRFASLARLLTGTDRLATLLPSFHQHAVEAAGGSCSVLLQFDPRTNRLRATSAYGLDDLPIEPWPDSPAETRLLDLTFREARPVLVNADQLPALQSVLRTEAVMLAPLLRLQERVGVLAIGRGAGPASADMHEEVEGVGHAFVLALDRARAYRNAELQRDLRTLLYEFSRTVNSSLTLAAGLEAFCEGANRLFAADRTSVWMHDRRSREMVLEASSDAAYLALGGRVSTADSLAPAAVALRRERAEVASTVPNEDQVEPTVVVTVPLKGRRRALGTLVFERVRLDPGAEFDLPARADEVGRQLSAAIENVQLLEVVLRSRRELENTFNSIADLVLVADRRGRVVHANLALAERLGKSREELHERPIEEVVGPEMVKLAADIELENERDNTAGITRELEDPLLTGVFSVTVTRLVGESREPLGFVLVARDVTPRARLEAERAELRSRLTQSEKLAALGQLVAGIAHELNNPLQGVLGHLELLRTTGAFPASLRREVRLIYREADRAAKIVRNLLVFAGSRKLTRRRLSVNAVLARAIALRAPACRAVGIEVIRQYDERLPRVLGDPVLLQQALLNILINAEQAVGEVGGGRIEVRTTLKPSRDMIVATVRDTGRGLAPEVLPRIFEPFYTTKEVGKGTGLGLAIAYGIIQEHGGAIHATNHPDGGAIFTVELPVEAS
jgi:PAS domain S-box-containing protein